MNLNTSKTKRKAKDQERSPAKTITAEFRGLDYYRLPGSLSRDDNYQTLRIKGKQLPPGYEVTYFDYDKTTSISVRGKSFGFEKTATIPKEILQAPGEKRAVITDKNKKFIGIMFFNVE